MSQTIDQVTVRSKPDIELDIEAITYVVERHNTQCNQLSLRFNKLFMLTSFH